MIKPFLYKTLAIIFLIVIFVLAGLILNFYLSKAEITVTAAQEELTADFTQNLDLIPQAVKKLDADKEDNPITDEIRKLREVILGQPTETLKATEPAIQDSSADLSASSLTAKYYETILEDTYNFIPTGQEQETEGKAQGIVAIINNSNRSQPLIVTTRLLTSTGVLFRMKKGVTVPPGGKIEVEVEADKAGAIGDIGPSVFSIPGLSASLQKLIYAESQNPFAGGLKILKQVTTADLDQAKKIAAANLTDQSLTEFNRQDSTIALDDLYPEVLDFKAETQVGETVESFSGQIKVKVSALSFNRDQLQKKAEKKLAESQTNKFLLSVKENSLTYKIVKIDPAAKTAELEVNIGGYFSLEDGGSLIKPANLVGLSAKEIQDQILTNKSVSGVTVRFSPFWVNKAPRLIKNIKIIVNTEK